MNPQPDFIVYPGDQANGIRSVYYSYDVGVWHFLSLPANIEFGNYDDLEVVKPMMEWLERNLEANKTHPTVILIHMHLMPLGLTQLEWYTHTTQLQNQEPIVI